VYTPRSTQALSRPYSRFVINVWKEAYSGVRVPPWVPRWAYREASSPPDSSFWARNNWPTVKREKRPQDVELANSETGKEARDGELANSETGVGSMFPSSRELGNRNIRRESLRSREGLFSLPGTVFKVPRGPL